MALPRLYSDVILFHLDLIQFLDQARPYTYVIILGSFSLGFIFIVRTQTQEVLLLKYEMELMFVQIYAISQGIKRPKFQYITLFLSNFLNPKQFKRTKEKCQDIASGSEVGVTSAAEAQLLWLKWQERMVG